MKQFLITFGLICLSQFGFGQATSTHYSSPARGTMTHYGTVSNNHAQTNLVNIWTEGHEQSSSYAVNRNFGQQDQPTLHISNINLRNALSFYPNPVTTSLNITTEGDIRIHSITCVSARGTVFRFGSNQKNANGNSLSLAMGHLPAGLYLIKVETSNGVLIKRITKI